MLPLLAQATDGNSSVENVTLILRRLEQPFPKWGVLVPVAGVLLLYLIIMYQRGSHLTGPWWSRLPRRLMGPPWALALVLVACGVYVFLGSMLATAWFAWYLVLVPVVALGLFYTVFMYVRDARSVGWAWASFLGLLRGTVYLILAAVFLLPAEQKTKTTETRSKVVVVFDVSASMQEVDDLPALNQDPKTLPRRIDKVISLLTDDQARFLRNLLKTNPVTCYRFGLKADENPRNYANPRRPWTRNELLSWLVIDPERKGIRESQAELEGVLYRGTNIADSLLQVFEKEGNNKLQAVVLVSDGQNNDGQEESYRNLETLAEKASVPIFCLGVGKYKPPINIKVNDLEVPQSARPDEPFPVVVPVASRGLKGEKYQVQLEVRRVLDRDGKPVKEDAFPAQRRDGTHKDDEPDRVEFEMNVAELKGVDVSAVKALKDSSEQEKEWAKVEGTWEFRARVARDPREAYNKPFHLSPPAQVKVSRKKLRVLLFAGGPGREYQFVKTLFYREVLEKRMEVGVYLQTNDKEEIDLAEDAPQEWVLDHFPDLKVPASPKDKPYTLYDYDLIIAFDPDWEALSPDDLTRIKDWVQDNNGGLVLIAGPVNTYQVRKLKEDKENDKLGPIRALYPVVLEDSRLLGLGEGFNPTTPYALKWVDVQAKFDFLKLNEKGERTTAGWDEFFYGTEQPEHDAEPVRGFFRYYPVEKAKSTATVIATFPVDKNAGENRPDEPYLVAMPAGTGKVVYLGSDEMWRLRMFEGGEQYFERFWIKLARYAGSGNMGRLRAYGESNIAERMTTGDKKRIEYHLRGPDRNFLGPDASVNLVVMMSRFKNPEDAKPDPATRQKIDLKPKPGNDRNKPSGWFMADFSIKDPGKYQFELRVPGTPETLINNVIVTQPNPELDNTRPNLARLYRLASKNTLVLNRLKNEFVKAKLRELEPPEDEADKSAGRKGERLYFDLASAPLIPECMVTDRDEKITKGDAPYWWDRGWDTDYEVFGQPFQIAWVLTAVVGLLSLEWLTRKLLKLA